MVKISRACPYLGIRFFDHPFWVNWAENFCGNSKQFDLSIGDEKVKLWCRCSFFIWWATFGGKMEWPLRAPLMVWCWHTMLARRGGTSSLKVWGPLNTKPNQKVINPLGGPFWPSAISKSCLPLCCVVQSTWSLLAWMQAQRDAF